MDTDPDADALDPVFRALADPSRRRLLDRLNNRNGQTLRELCVDLAMSRQAVSKHLSILESSQLVATVRHGREKLHYLNAAPIHEISERWIQHYDRARVQALGDLKRALEDETMTPRPEFVYSTYIRTTPERLWAALTQPAFTRRYWDTELRSDWAPGSTITWTHNDVSVADPEQVVLICEPYHRLAYTWHSFTPEWAESYGIEASVRAQIATERRSRVTFELVPDGPLVKLTVVHDDFDPGSTVAEMVREGWPRVLADLKTLLETGGTDDEGFAAEFTIDAPADRVFTALTTIDGLASWWTPQVSGSPAVGDDVTFAFDEHERAVMHVEHAEVGRAVVWTCRDSKHPEWPNTSVWFDIQPRDENTSVLSFRHVGLTSGLNCYDICSRGWDHYLASLVSYAETGTGNPYGSEAWAAQFGSL